MSGARVRRTIGQMAELGFTAHVSCAKCREYRQIDLSALVAKVGPDYSLWNRRCRCRMTPGCDGWNRFFVGPGWHVAAFDERTEWRWTLER